MIGWLKERFRRRESFFAAVEYWVYHPNDAEVDHSVLLSKLLNENPYGARAFGRAEGLLFSDVRTHLGFVKRQKNPHAFRPDLFEQAVQPTAEALTALGEANAFTRVRYVSEIPLSDKKHCQFCAVTAGVVAELAKARVVYDVVTESLYGGAQFSGLLRDNPDASRFELQVRINWCDEDDGGYVETKGLVKLGLPELVTHPLSKDQRVLAMEIMEVAARQLWDSPVIPVEICVEAYDDEFLLTLEPVRNRQAKVRLLRRQAIK